MMQTILKTGNLTLWLYVAILLVMAGFWRAGEAINSKLAALPIKTAPRAAKTENTLDQKSFYSVWVKQVLAAAPATADDEQAVDALFQKKIEKIEMPPPVVPPEPDYGAIFRSQANISGVADNGVFINDKFYSVGQKIDDLAMRDSQSRLITPLVQSMQAGQVTFLVGKSKVVFTTGSK